VSKLKIEVGKYYKTRCGKKAKVKYKLDGPYPYPYPWIGMIFYDEREYMATWSEKGASFFSGDYHGDDIISEWSDDPSLGWVYKGEHYVNPWKFVHDLIRDNLSDERPLILVNMQDGSVASFDKNGIGGNIYAGIDFKLAASVED